MSKYVRATQSAVGTKQVRQHLEEIDRHFGLVRFFSLIGVEGKSWSREVGASQNLASDK